MEKIPQVMFPLLRSFKLKIKTKLWQYSSFFLSFNSPQILSNITPFIFHVNFCSLKDTERNRDRGGRTINASHLCIGVGATTEHGLPTSGHTPKEESSLPKKLSAGYGSSASEDLMSSPPILVGIWWTWSCSCHLWVATAVVSSWT